MATANPRGVQVSDVPSSLRAVVQADSAAIVAVGAAPVHSLPGYTWITPGSGVSPWAAVVNHPVLCEIPSDFTTQLGVSSVFGPGIVGSVNGTGNYPLAEVYDLEFVENNASPLIAINVFDPWTMSILVTQNNLTVTAHQVSVSGEVILPATVITPGWGANTSVIAAANSHVQNINNGRFRAIYISDINTAVAAQYTQVNAQKSAQNLQTPFEIAVWPNVGLGGKRYHGSTMLAVMMQNTDAAYGGIPYVSPSNKVPTMDSTILGTGAQIVVDPTQADYLEQLGVVTFINFQGWKSLGDYTCSYPTDTSVQDFWINERRMFNWLGSTLSLTLSQFIDLPGNIASLTSINETIQSYGNTLVQKGAANTLRVSFNPNENLAAQVIAGIYTFHILWTPPTPIRTLDLLLQFDVNGLTAWISQINLVSTQ